MISWLQSLLALPLAVRLAPQLRTVPRNWQERRDAGLRRIVAHGSDRTAFYRRRWAAAGVDARQITTVAELARLPIIARADWRTATASEIEVDEWPNLVTPERSGGTTGAPFEMHYNFSDIVRNRAIIMAVYLARGLRWHGLFIPDPKSRCPRDKRWRRSGQILTLSRKVEPAQVGSLVQTARPHLVRGAPSLFWQACVAALRAGQPLPRVPLLVAVGEILTPTVRATLQRALADQIVGHYGASDSGHLAAECAAGNLHVCWYSAQLEIVDGERPVKPGEEGEVVVTNFTLSRRPLIRVRTGDRAAWGSGVCPCGHLTPYLAYVAGRNGDQISLPDGRTLSWPVLETALAQSKSTLLGYQFEQLDQRRVIARLSFLEARPRLAELEQLLIAALPGMEIEIYLTDHLGDGTNRKSRPVVGLSLSGENQVSA